VRILWLVALSAALGLSGCGKDEPSLTAGGKSPDHWVRSLKDPDIRVRKRAVKKLANVGTAAQAAVPALAGALKDRDPGVRAEAALALLRIGPGAKEAVPALAEAARQDASPRVRACAGKALEKVRAGD
jgi:HEAT repeat protein